MTLVLVAALDQAHAIGKGNALPWHLPEDLKRFKRITLGLPILMGGNTARSLGRALPGRRNLVLTRSGHAPFQGMEAMASLDEALAAAEGQELAVIGGGEIYRLTLPFATALRLTHVQTRVEGADAWFPDFDARHWRETWRERHEADARHAHAFDFVDYRREA